MTPSARRRGVYATPVVVGILLVGLVAGTGWAIRHSFNPFTAINAATPAPTLSVSASPTPDASAEPTPTETVEVRPVINDATQIGPAMECTGEQPEQAANTIDGDPSTSWWTCLYKGDPVFSGIKTGAGLTITLKEPAPVTGITLLTDGTGGNVQIRAAGTAGDVATGDVLAEGPIAPTTTLTFTQPQTIDSFVVWFTELPADGGGQTGFRVRLYEITVQ
jgi:hypothetical protein